VFLVYLYWIIWSHIPEGRKLCCHYGENFRSLRHMELLILLTFSAGKILSTTVVPGEGKHAPCCDDGNKESIS
jgi:hypothetical protein